MRNFIRLQSDLDVEPLNNQVDENPDLWDQITARQTTPGSPHKYTRSIFIRWAQSRTVQAAFTDLKAVNYPASEILTSANPLVQSVWAEVRGVELGRVLVVELEPGGVISWHSDQGVYADHFERFHICLKSESGNVFLSEHEPDQGEFVHMKPGELWYFNHKAPHFLVNHSHKPRRHLIVDMVAPEFRRERV